MEKSKFKTEIGPNFTVERHKDYTVIGPMKFYADEEKEAKYRKKEITITTDEVSEIFRKYGPDADYKAMIFLGIVIFIGILLWILSPIIIGIERYYGINV